MIAVAFVFAAGLLLYAFLQRGVDTGHQSRSARRFDETIAAERSPLVRALLTAARPLGGHPIANPPEESPAYRTIRLKLAAAGGAYGGYVEVFLATQIAATIIGVTSLAAVVALRPSGVVALAMVVGGASVIGWPWVSLREDAGKRADEINTALPEFAELLMMPLNSGFGILPALDFTAARLDGPVADEVKNLTESIRSRSRTEAEAFADAGEQLGTSAAKSFSNVLSQAYLEGVQVVETLEGQAMQLRVTEHERLRERIGKMENSIAVMTGIHLIPSLFLVIMYPALGTMTGV